MAMPLVEVPPEVVAPVRSPVTTTVSVPPPVLLPKFTVLLAPMPVELVPPSTVEAPAHVTAVPSAAWVAKVIVSPAPEAWIVCAAVIEAPIETTPSLRVSPLPPPPPRQTAGAALHRQFVAGQRCRQRTQGQSAGRADAIYRAQLGAIDRCRREVILHHVLARRRVLIAQREPDENLI